ncbi:MAG: hypothetical protein EZS28_032770 [Streblomastix strix]|uniref:Uncharacterized protein n=1 Tax=Streblomastix strix TaxID=222440 RepID=A0A5J4UN37_9EUKA|nr:MAG: hypothetical protein EZS28_032770 [Streblomastix strix]
MERYVIQERANIQAKPISERIKGALIVKVNYIKIGQKECEKKQITGKQIDLNLVEDGDLCVIDFDINKNLSKEKTDVIRQNTIDNMLPANVGLVKTSHSGLHAYYYKNRYHLPNNRYPVQNREVGSNTSIRETKNNVRETLKYEVINDWANMTHLVNPRDILKKWNADLEILYIQFYKYKITIVFEQQISNVGTIDKKVDAELAQSWVDGLKNLTIHNYPQQITIKESLLCVFSGIYGIANEQIRGQGLENVRKFNTLIPNAEKNYEQALGQGVRNPNAWILTKILKFRNKDYYEQTIKPLFKKNYEAKKLEKQILLTKH